MMRPRLTAGVVTFVAGILLGSVLPAAAQTAQPTFELSAGYQYTHVPDQELPLGFAIDGARNLGSFGLVAEGGWAHGSDDESGIDTSLNLWHLGAGARVTRNGGRARPFAQVLGGWIQGRTSAEIGGGDISESSNHFMLPPGGGGSLQAGDGWAVVGSVDYRRVFFSGDDSDESGENEFRVFVGIRMLLD